VRDANAARLGQRLQPRRDIDSVAEDVATIDDDVTEIDADAKADAPRLRNVPVAVEHGALDLGSAAHRVDDTAELHQQSVAGGLDDAAAMFGDLRVDEFPAMRLQPRKRALFVVSH
jgi:hypothetical protein